LKKDASYAEAIDNLLVLTAILGKNVEELTAYVLLARWTAGYGTNTATGL